MNTPEVLEYAVKAVGLIAALLGVIYTLPSSLKTWRELAYMRQSRRREEYEFATTLGKSTGDKSVLRYAEELGYAALIGDRHLSHAQRQFLLTLPRSEQRISAYMGLRSLLEIFAAEKKFIWKKPRHSSARYRKGIRIVGYGAYVTFCFLAFAPLLYWNATHSGASMPSGTVVIQIFFASYCLPSAAFFLVQAVRLGDAQTFMLEVAHDLADSSAETGAH